VYSSHKQSCTKPMHRSSQEFKSKRKEIVYLAHAPIPSDCALLDALVHMHPAHPRKGLSRPILFFLSFSRQRGRHGWEVVLHSLFLQSAYFFNPSSQKLLNTHTMLCKQSIEGINKERERKIARGNQSA
jgi:hypothetical protein